MSAAKLRPPSECRFAGRPSFRHPHAQATSGVGGLIAVSADSAAPRERGRSTPAMPAEAIGVFLGVPACEARFACKSAPTERDGVTVAAIEKP